MRRNILFIFVCVAAAFLSFQLCIYAQPPGGGRGDRDNNPPGPKGGAGTNWENPPGKAGGPGANSDRIGPRGDRDNNPPGPRGGPGTNWENPPGPVGGPGTDATSLPEQRVGGSSQDSGLEQKAIVDKPWEQKADANKDGVVNNVEIQQWKEVRGDRDNNPPGTAGGPGTNWENPPGKAGGPGASPNRKR